MQNKDMILQALSKIEDKIDRVDSRLDSVEKVQIKQEGNLGEHMRRTALAEENMSILRKDMTKGIEAVQTELKPVQKHVAYMEGFLKGLGILATVALIIEGFVSLVQFLHH